MFYNSPKHKHNFCAIYRGAGGAGDAVSDSSSEASAAVIAKDAAEAAAIAAEAAKVAAQLAETNAETAETNAETAETNAETAASNALTSANNASNSAVSAASSASAASSSASSASTSATNAANSSTTAAGSASAAAISATAASNSASSASGYATTASNAATSATASAASATSSAADALASKNAAATSATNAASSASTANSAATTATTQAGISTTQATNAANSASAASTSATNASNSASAAATSASNAATSASNAATSATSSASSASASQAAADAALAALDSFDDRYLGQKASAPTVDNDGNALVTGALYFDTTDDAMKVWDGSAWLAAYASLSGALLAANNLSDLSNTVTARANLGVAIGTNVQAWDADLDAFAAKTAPTGAVVGTSDTQTLTNKTIALGSNTVSGTLAEFNTAVTDADLASIAGTETLTNKTLTSPVISGGSINNASVGASTASTGAFTTLSASGAFSANGGATLGDASGDALTINSSAVSIPNGLNFDSNTFVIDATNNRVGVGVASPNYPLSVQGSSVEMGFSPQSGIGYLGNFSNVPLAFVVNNSERMRLDSIGNLGVNTNSTVASGTGVAIYSGSVARLTLRNSTTGDTSTDGSGLFVSGSDFGIENREAGSMILYTSNTERMRITSAGNVGIGTSSPNYLLSVQANSVQMGMSPQSGIGYLGNYSNAPIGFVVNNSEKMRLDTSGNLGLGVTPSAVSGRAFEIGAVGHGLAYRGAADINLTQNAYWLSGSWRYGGTTGVGVSVYQQVDGQHRWLTAPSGTAGNAITFTQAMTLDASGKLGLGTTSPLQLLHLSSASSPLIQVTFQGVGASQIGVVSGNALTFGLDTSNGSTERMRITSAGNVGIGTSSPDRSFVVNNTNASGNIALLQNGSTNTRFFLSSDPTSGGGVINISNQAGSAALPFIVQGNGTERMRIDSSGNLGLGVTPSAWRSTAKAIEAPAGSVWDLSTTVKGVGQNAFLDSVGWKYKSTAAATNYEQAAGTHAWFTAPSGTAGNAITFTQAMTLDASGNLLVGTTGAMLGASGRGNITLNGSTDNIITLGIAGSYSGYWYSNATRMELDAQGSRYIQFNTNGNERFRIGTAGQIGIGGANYGTSGQVLTSNGSGSAPSWAAAPAPASLSTASGSAPSYSARAWVNFNGTGTVAIRGSGNVSSITDNGTGDYTLNFTTAMPDANYSISGYCLAASGGGSAYIVLGNDFPPSAGSCRVGVGDIGNGARDVAFVMFQVFR